MNTNFTQARNWIISAINDIDRIAKNLKRKDFAAVAFRSQFAIEKLNKALLSYMGIKIEKTHTPSKLLKDILKDEEILTFDDETEEILNNIIKFSIYFEEQGTITRYGTIKNEIWIFPEDIYNSVEDVKEFIVNLVNMVNNYLILLNKTFNITSDEFKELKNLKKLLKKLRKWT